MDLSIIFGFILPVAIADQFTFPPAPGAAGAYISDVGFTVGQQMTFEWDNTTGTSPVSFWLIQDDSLGECSFQADAQCQLIGSEYFLSSVGNGK
jgi:hypothetical protein